MSLAGAIAKLRAKGSPDSAPGNPGEPPEAPEIGPVPPVPSVPPQEPKAEGANHPGGPLADTPAPILPAPWDAIRDRIQAGWRAEFGPPDAEGRQLITWREPGTWLRTARNTDPAPMDTKEART
jgi:hypothetical protein